ncbi:PBP1A family penicillin-binding protein [Bradyrhizobium sp.]|uniref:PBP1A family penicillin-binding protein n=1 Tax=Bradyrhizobium sp. TaxID=376 RepID=UPI001ECC066C|nr:PBP1A family penicillin-binding protein [Bradyrhizobium sp.]MBV9980924.1 PBP1A family penicillin-binding protein [Bradyrhizobium sp.]
MPDEPIANAVDSREPLASNPDPGEGGRRSAGRPRWGYVVATLLCLVFIVAASIAAGFLVAFPWPTAAEVTSRRVIVMTSADGHDLFRKGNLQLAPVAVKDMPATVIDAVLSIEDRRFYRHHGVDPLSMVRAFRANSEAGRVVAGGSTITQQLVKILFLGPQRTYKRKIQEAAMSLWIEHHLTKDEILTSYLNNVYLGSGTVGFPAAAKVYFGKTVDHLSLAEAAMLAGMINAPSHDDPFHDLGAARKRATSVIDAMVANGKLTEEDALVAKLHPATPVAGESAPASTGWFADWVYNKAAPIIPASGGTVRLRTTLDLRLQELAQNIVQSTLAKSGGEKNAGQAALVAMRPNGAVLAMVGGRNYDSSQYNRAVDAERQPGSAFKLFDYYAALRQGYTPDDTVLDAPIDIRGWQPKNYGHRHRGEVTLADAFADSLNDAAVRLAQQVGIGEVISAARDLGLRAPLKNNPSLALGSNEVTLLDLTSAYAAVRAGQAPVSPRGIAALVTEKGDVPADASGTAQHSLGQYQSQLIALLRGVVEHGTGRAAALQGFAAGKTGTAQDYRDAWFIGFDDHLVVGVWVGNDDHTPMNRVTGGSLPAKIWKDFVEQAEQIAAVDVNSPASGAPATTVGQSSGGTSPERAIASDQDRAAAADGSLAPASAESHGGQCNVAACEQFYHSFRSSDCTYQPYSGGPRQYCAR